MIYSLKKDIVFVRGACRGAIYNFDNGKVYSLSERATSSVYKLCINDCLTDSDRTIIDKLSLNEMIIYEKGLKPIICKNNK